MKPSQEKSPTVVAGIGAALARFALNKPVTIGMLFFSMLLFGLVSSRLLPLEKFPGIDIPQMVIEIPYPDATPIEVETMITRPVEAAIATMSGIKRLQARSYDNRAEIVVEFDWEENLKAKSIEAREKVDAIRNELPSDIERIMVYKFNTNDMPIFQLRVSSDAAQKEALAASPDARAANATLYKIVDALKGAKPKDIKALCEANGVPILNGTKPRSGVELLMAAADGARSVRAA